MDFKTDNGSVSVALGVYSKSEKTEFFRLLQNGGYRGDFSKAWKDYQDASYKASRKKKK